MTTALVTDFTIGLLNNKNCGTGITEGNMIQILKKVNKSNGFQIFSFILPTKYLKYVKEPYMTKPMETKKAEYTEAEKKIDYETIYKNSVMVFTTLSQSAAEAADNIVRHDDPAKTKGHPKHPLTDEQRK